MNCFRKHENIKCQDVQCSVRDCAFRHPRKCRYFTEYNYCKFGEYCKFDHEVFEKGNNEEIIEIRRKLEELNSKIKAKDEEIKLKDVEIEMMNKKVNDKIATLEDKINDVEFKLNEIMEENNLLKKMIDSKSSEFDKTTKIQEIVREKKNE